LRDRKLVTPYILDVAFGEEGSRLRKDKGPENMTILRKLALTVAWSDNETKNNSIGRRKRSNEYMEKLLFNPPLPPIQGNLYDYFALFLYPLV
jgi:hypothetical protein